MNIIYYLLFLLLIVQIFKITSRGVLTISTVVITQKTALEEKVFNVYYPNKKEDENDCCDFREKLLNELIEEYDARL